MKRFHASASFLQDVKSIFHGQRSPLVAVSDASGRQVFHPDDRYPGLGVSGVNADHVIVFGPEHHLGFGEHHTGWQTSGNQVLGCAVTVQADVLFESHLSEEAAP